jgi:hypothetical protein
MADDAQLPHRELSTTTTQMPWTLPFHYIALLLHVFLHADQWRVTDWNYVSEVLLEIRQRVTRTDCK